MKSIKKIKEENRGSILILTMLALVGAISIAVAMASVSIVERKMTTKSRKSTTAFQSANSGIEWAMKKINDADGTDAQENISDLFNRAVPDDNGQIDCDNDIMFSNNSGLKCKITFLQRNATGTRDIIIGDAPMEDVVAIRSSGTFGTDTEQVGRALEAYAMPNCGSSAERVADFCIDDADKPGSPDSHSWGEAIATCESAGKRLCTAAELVAANEVISGLSDLIAADVVTSNTVLIDGSDIGMEAKDYTGNYRCCRNR
jgi:MFS superfamily sulfate permease-like transporter